MFASQSVHEPVETTAGVLLLFTDKQHGRAQKNRCKGPVLDSGTDGLEHPRGLHWNYTAVCLTWLCIQIPGY